MITTAMMHLQRTVSLTQTPAMMMLAAGAAVGRTTTVVAAAVAATAFNHTARTASAGGVAPEDLKDGRVERSVARFYGAVGYTLCATLWDPGSSINMVTPAFADELVKRKGLRWKYCAPMEVQHGSGDVLHDEALRLSKGQSSLKSTHRKHSVTATASLKPLETHN